VIKNEKQQTSESPLLVVKSQFWLVKSHEITIFAGETTRGASTARVQCIRSLAETRR
jgi:hypothetical protein